MGLINDIIKNGCTKKDRTEVGVLSRFGGQMRFSLKDNIFPLLTTKRVFWRGVAEELFWFIKGDTNSHHLKEKGVNIWDGNSSRKFLDTLGLKNREDGDIGPCYGFQWRHWGAEYIDMHKNYGNEGIDQLKECIHKIKNNPDDRRIIMTAWNPSALHLMALPPCHMLCQFYVANGELSCLMYQRSCDMGLGVPFNIASYALLTKMMAHVCNLKCGEFIHTLGDMHIYLTHLDAIKTQMRREPVPFPTLEIIRDVKNIEDFTINDFKLVDYNPAGRIKMEMAI